MSIVGSELWEHMFQKCTERSRATAPENETDLHDAKESSLNYPPLTLLTPSPGEPC